MMAAPCGTDYILLEQLKEQMAVTLAVSLLPCCHCLAQLL